MVNRARSVFLAVLVAVVTVFPQRQVYAIAPVVPLVAAAVTSTGSRLAFQGAVTLTGALIAYLSFKIGDKEVQVPSGSFQNSDAAMPKPNVPATTNQTGGGYDQWPSDEQFYLMCEFSGSWSCGPTPQTYAQCKAWLDLGPRSYAVGCRQSGSGKQPISYRPGTVSNINNDPVFGGRPCGSTNQTGAAAVSGCVDISAPGGCPSGYIVVNGSCSLQNARLVQADNAIAYSDTAGTFAVVPDKDQPPEAVRLNQNGSVTISGVDESGKPMVVEVSPIQNGQRLVNVTQQTTTAANANAVQSQTITVNESGQVISVSASAPVPGQITSPGTSSVTTTTTGQQSQMVDFVFPSDYARIGEAGAAADKVVQAIDTLKQTDQVGDPEAPEWSDPWEGPFADLLGWRLPAHAAVCPTLTLDVFDSVNTMTTHCQLIEDNRSLIDSISSVCWTLVALFIVLGA